MTHSAFLVRTSLFVSALSALGCSQSPTAPRDAAVADASTRPDAPFGDGAANDSRVGDVDATTRVDASGSDSGDGCNVCLAEAIAWGTDGGRACTRDSSALSPCRGYAHARVAEGCDPPDRTCENQLPCSGTGALRPEEIAAALSHPDVIAALAAAPVFYGTDPRPFDGAIDWLTVGDSGRVEVGTGSVPAGVAALVSLLRDIAAQQLTIAGCVEVFPGG